MFWNEAKWTILAVDFWREFKREQCSIYVEWVDHSCKFKLQLLYRQRPPEYCDLRLISIVTSQGSLNTMPSCLQHWLSVYCYKRSCHILCVVFCIVRHALLRNCGPCSSFLSRMFSIVLVFVLTASGRRSTDHRANISTPTCQAVQERQSLWYNNIHGRIR